MLLGMIGKIKVSSDWFGYFVLGRACPFMRQAVDLTFLSILRELVVEEGSRVLFTFRNVLVFGGCNITV